MARQKINLKYSSNSLGFFNAVNRCYLSIESYKKELNTKFPTEFTEEDESEIGRDNTYAFFDKLKDKEITVNDFRNTLQNRKITDIEFQNKILQMVLQSKAAVPFGIAEIINAVFSHENGDINFSRKAQNSKLEVNSDKNVTYIFTAGYGDKFDEKSSTIEVCIKVNISPDMVSITECTLTKTSDDKLTTEEYNHLKGQQQNILMKLLTFIRHALGFDSELRLEEKQKDDISWAPPPVSW